MRWLLAVAMLSGLMLPEACSHGDDTRVSDSGVADTRVGVDYGFEVWVSPERCPRLGIGVVEGFPCSVVGAECLYACGDFHLKKDQKVFATCVDGVWSLKQTPCGF
jgi:hypothetical protein